MEKVKIEEISTRRNGAHCKAFRLILASIGAEKLPRRGISHESQGAYGSIAIPSVA